MKSSFFKILFMSLNLGIIIYALLKFILYKGDSILTPLPFMLIVLGICCLAINVTYIFFTLAPLFKIIRFRIMAKVRDQKDMTTQGTVPREVVSADFDQETVAIEADPVKDA